MRVFHELSDEELATLFHQRTLAILAELRDYDCNVVLPVDGGGLAVLALGIITTQTETYQVYNIQGLLQGYYQSAARAVRKLMERSSVTDDHS